MNIEDLMKTPEYNIKLGGILEHLLINSIANNLLSSQKLKQQLEIKELIKEGKIKDQIVEDKYSLILNALGKQATDMKNEIILNLYQKE